MSKRYTTEQLDAIEFLRVTEGHSCYVCRGGEADCSTIADRGDAWDILRGTEPPRVELDSDFPF